MENEKVKRKSRFSIIFKSLSSSDEEYLDEKVLAEVAQLNLESDKNIAAIQKRIFATGTNSNIIDKVKVENAKSINTKKKSKTEKRENLEDVLEK